MKIPPRHDQIAKTSVGIDSDLFINIQVRATKTPLWSVCMGDALPLLGDSVPQIEAAQIALQGAEGFPCDQVDVIGSLATSPDLSLNIQLIGNRGLQHPDRNRNTFLEEREQECFFLFLIASLGRDCFGRASEKSFMRLALRLGIEFQWGWSGDRMSRHEFRRINILRDDPARLLEFLYANAGSLEPDFPKLDLALLGDGNSLIREFLERKAPKGELSWEVIQLVTQQCVNVGRLTFKKLELAIALLNVTLVKKANVEVLLEFIDKFGLRKFLVPFVREDLHSVASAIDDSFIAVIETSRRIPGEAPGRVHHGSDHELVAEMSKHGGVLYARPSDGRERA
jgi:hypothetical protein